MDEQVRLLSDDDPANLLPFTCQLIPDDPTIERLPAKYIGTDRTTYGVSELF